MIRAIDPPQRQQRGVAEFSYAPCLDHAGSNFHCAVFRALGRVRKHLKRQAMGFSWRHDKGR
jgi:hypothetical protein